MGYPGGTAAIGKGIDTGTAVAMEAELEDTTGWYTCSQSSSLVMCGLSWCLLCRLGFVWIRMWRVSSSERENRLPQPWC